MRRARRAGIIIGVAGVCLLGSSGVAGAAPDGGCTLEGEPVGQFVSFIAQEFGHSGDFNPGHNAGGPFVPAEQFEGFGPNCNPTGNPTPPPRNP